jgi:hypothetical protein
MKTRRISFWTVLSGMVLIGAFTLWVILVSSPFLFLWYINTPYPYGPPKETIEYFTDVALSDSTAIDLYDVSNFWLDGPDYYYELTLSPEDKTRLISSFGGPCRSPGGIYDNAIARVPSTWIRGRHPRVKCYYFQSENDSRIYLDIDTESDKAWLVILSPI